MNPLVENTMVVVLNCAAWYLLIRLPDIMYPKNAGECEEPQEDPTYIEAKRELDEWLKGGGK